MRNKALEFEQQPKLEPEDKVILLLLLAVQGALWLLIGLVAGWLVWG